MVQNGKIDKNPTGSSHGEQLEPKRLTHHTSYFGHTNYFIIMTIWSSSYLDQILWECKSCYVDILVKRAAVQFWWKIWWKFDENEIFLICATLLQILVLPHATFSFLSCQKTNKHTSRCTNEYADKQTNRVTNKQTN